MAYIKYSKKREQVYEKCCERGTTFYDWVWQEVEHWRCSECGAEVNKDSKFCSECGEKFNKRKD